MPDGGTQLQMGQTQPLTSLDEVGLTKPEHFEEGNVTPLPSLALPKASLPLLPGKCSHASPLG